MTNACSKMYLNDVIATAPSMQSESLQSDGVVNRLSGVYRRLHSGAGNLYHRMSGSARELGGNFVDALRNVPEALGEDVRDAAGAVSGAARDLGSLANDAFRGARFNLFYAAPVALATAPAGAAEIYTPSQEPVQNAVNEASANLPYMIVGTLGLVAALGLGAYGQRTKKKGEAEPSKELIDRGKAEENIALGVAVTSAVVLAVSLIRYMQTLNQ